jgi:hypothetical protein
MSKGLKSLSIFSARRGRAALAHSKKEGSRGNIEFALLWNKNTNGARHLFAIPERTLVLKGSL